MEDIQRQHLLQDTLDIAQLVYTDRYTNTLARIDDPEKSYVAVLHSMISDADIAQHIPGEPAIESKPFSDDPGATEYMIAELSSIVDPQSLLSFEVRVQLILDRIGRNIKLAQIEEKMRLLCCAGIVASGTINAADKKNRKLHKAALAILNNGKQAAHKGMRSQVKLHRAINEAESDGAARIHQRLALRDPATAASATQYMNDLAVYNFADRALFNLSVIKKTDAARNACDELYIRFGAIPLPSVPNRKPPPQDLDDFTALRELATEVGWEILPPDVLDDTGLREFVGGNSPDTTPEERGIQLSRLKLLRFLVDNWPEIGAYVAVSDLKTYGTDRYIAVALPERLPNGLLIEHALAVNPKYGNGPLLFRGEQGLSLDGSRIEYTWRDVFSGTRKAAQLLGAIKLVTTPSLPERVQDMLSASDHEKLC